MKQEQYEKCTEFFRQPGGKSFLMFVLSRLIPTIVANIYIILLILALLASPVYLLRFAGVPLIAFLIVTILRKVINKKRPYEVYDFHPIAYKKLKPGQSFPSRHAASAFVIAVACLSMNTVLGVIMVILAVIVSASRVLSGMHFISDVVGGMIIGVIVGLIGFYSLIF